MERNRRFDIYHYSRVTVAKLAPFNYMPRPCCNTVRQTRHAGNSKPGASILLIGLGTSLMVRAIMMVPWTIWGCLVWCFKSPQDSAARKTGLFRLRSLLVRLPALLHARNRAMAGGEKLARRFS